VETETVVPMETKTIIVPRIPLEIMDEILDHLAADSDLGPLQSCALVSKSWVPSCRRHLFHTVLFTLGSILRWHKTFPVPEASPAHYIRDLRVWAGGSDGSPSLFFKYAPWITNVERVTLLGDGRWIPTFWRLPQSVTSLTMKTDASNLIQVRDIMAQLRNLDDLSLSGSVVTVDREGSTVVGIGTDLRGKFGGQLQLLNGYADEDAINVLLEIPTGLRFAEVEIRGTRGCLLSAVRLAEACCMTLVKLSYTASFQCTSHPFFWSGGF